MKNLQARNHNRKLTAIEKARLRHLATYGQEPTMMVVSCADSRIDWSTIADIKPGEIFKLHHVSGWIPPYQDPEEGGMPATYSIASGIEYAIKNIPSIKEIVVMGHQNCGGIKSLLNDDKQTPSACGHWLAGMAPIRDTMQMICQGIHSKSEHIMATYLSVVDALKNLVTYPYVRTAVANGSVKLTGYYYHIGSNTLCPIIWRPPLLHQNRTQKHLDPQDTLKPKSSL